MAVHATSEVGIPADGALLRGDLTVPESAIGVVAFAHGSGSSRHSPRNRRVATALNDDRLATLLLDLLEPVEDEADRNGARMRFDIPLLARRLIAALDWLGREPATSALATGCFGASTGAAAALLAAAQHPQRVAAVVSRGGRPDLAGDALRSVKAPTLLIAGGNDPVVIELNQASLAELHGEAVLEIIPGAGHLFEEPGALERVELLARTWFVRWLGEAAGR
jgi:pimeloyl-ACP methyl ester carboxylesterase